MITPSSRPPPTPKQKSDLALELATSAVRFAYERYVQWRKADCDRLGLNCQADVQGFVSWVEDILR